MSEAIAKGVFHWFWILILVYSKWFVKLSMDKWFKLYRLHQVEIIIKLVTDQLDSSFNISRSVWSVSMALIRVLFQRTAQNQSSASLVAPPKHCVAEIYHVYNQTTSRGKPCFSTTRMTWKNDSQTPSRCCGPEEEQKPSRKKVKLTDGLLFFLLRWYLISSASVQLL